VIAIPLPPLKERKEDIPVLAQFFLRRFASETKKIFARITEAAQMRLAAYEWPGNVRELGNVIERAAVLGKGRRSVLKICRRESDGQNWKARSMDFRIAVPWMPLERRSSKKLSLTRKATGPPQREYSACIRLTF
jgi:DNA-binding NtrC family response regulator